MIKISTIKKYTKVVMIFFGALFFSEISYGDANSDLGNFFTNLGYANNVTESHAYQSQEGGYYSGGSLFLRSPSRDLQPINVQLPSMNSGCGGIDLFSGGFSFVKGSELVDFAKEVMTDSAPYAFQLAMETYAPQLNSVFSKLQYWAQQMNQNNLTSCEAAQNLVGGMWAKHTEAQRQICEDLSVQNNAFSDWASARQGCGHGGQGDSTLNNEQQTPEGKKIITRNVNIVWQALMQNDFLQKDTNLAQFFMSLSGTVIFDANGSPHVWTSLIGDQNILKAIMDGGTASIYACDNTAPDKCLNISSSSLSIDPSDALTARVNSMLLDIENKYAQDQPLTAEEEGFLNSTSIPVLKFIQVSLESGNEINTQNYAQMISQDLLCKYLEGIIKLIQQSLTYSSHFGSSQKQIMDGLAKASISVQNMKSNIYTKIQSETALIQQSIQYQKMIMGSLSSRFETGSTGQ